MKKKTCNGLIDVIFENYYKQVGYARENSYYTMRQHIKKDLQLFAIKLTGKLLDSRNIKEFYSCYLKITQ